MVSARTRCADEISEISALEQIEVMVETNAGTYSATEAFRAIRVGDPAFADCRLYARVGDGARRYDGCDPDRAPGRMRRTGYEELSRLRRRLADLRRDARHADEILSRPGPWGAR